MIDGASAASAPRSPRSLRFGALLLNLLPVLLPAIPFATIMAASNGYLGYGGVGIALYFGSWSAAMAIVLLGVNLALLWRRGQSLGHAYLGLVVQGGQRRSAVVLLAKVLVPPLLPFVVLQTTGSKEAFWYLLASTHVVDWLPWLGSTGQTLTDRLTGGRIRYAATEWRNGSFAYEALIIGPPLLLWPFHASEKGGGLGGGLAVLLSLLPLCVSRGVRAAKRRGLGH